jgi:hypothetical protein
MKSGGIMGCRKTMNVNTGERVKEWGNEIWKNYADSATLLLSSLKGVSACI